MKELIYTERVNKEVLKYILAHKDRYDLGAIYMNGCKTTNSTHTLLQKYYDALNELGETSIKYNQSSTKKFGRYWAQSIGITGISKKIRHTIAKEYNIDIDVVNCHPVLLEQICGRYNIECPKIKQYNSNRTKIVEEHPEMKQRVLEIINGSVSRDDDLKFIDKLYVECSTIRHSLKQHYPKIWKYIEKNTNNNVDGVFIANLLQDEENNILMAMVNAMNSRFQSIPITSLAYDGFTIQRSEESIELLDTILQTLEHEVFSETGFKIQLKVKDMTEGYNIDEMDDMCSCVFSHTYMNSLLKVIQLHCTQDHVLQTAGFLRGCSTGSCFTEFINVLNIDSHTIPEPNDIELYSSIMGICRLVPSQIDSHQIQALQALIALCSDKLDYTLDLTTNFKPEHDVYDFIEYLRTHVFNDYGLLIDYIVRHLYYYMRPVMFPKCCLLNMGDGVVDIGKHIDTTCRYLCERENKPPGIEKVKFQDILSRNQELFKPLKQFIFHPNEPSTDRVYNTYTGMKACLVDKVDMDMIRPILHHIKTCWANDDDRLYTYILSWLQHAFKYPWIKTEVVLLLFGLEGTGKNILIDNLIIPYIYGEHVSAVSHGLGPVTQRFNSICMNKLFICCNEVSAEGGFHTCFEKLKALITDKTMTIERKGIDIFESYNNFINFIFTTNNIDSVKLGQSDRRYCCIETSSRYKGNYEYFKVLAGTCNQESANHFYTYLYNMKSSINIRQIPHTKLKDDMSIHSKNSCELFIDDMKVILEERFANGIMNDDEKSFDNLFVKGSPKDSRISSAVLYDVYRNWCSTNNEKVKSSKEFVRCMNRHGYERKKMKINGKVVSGFEI